jgi:general secretion pathway protein B
MSYILDALKKSEKERQKMTVPDPLEIHDYISHEPTKRVPAWAYLLSVAAIMSIGLSLYLGNPWQSKKTEKAGIVSGEKSVALNAPASPSHDQPKNNARIAVTAEKEKEPEPKHTDTAKAGQSLRNSGKNEILQSAAQPMEKPKERAAQSGESTLSHPTAANEPLHTVQAAPVASGQKAESQTPAPDTNKIYAISELPLSLQQSLPAFTISAFLYSDDPGARMVRVNGKMMREGDALAEGLKLNEIRQDDLIFGYQNYRFRLGIK